MSLKDLLKAAVLGSVLIISQPSCSSNEEKTKTERVYSEVNRVDGVIISRSIKKGETRYLNPVDNINPLRDIDPLFDYKKSRWATKTETPEKHAVTIQYSYLGGTWQSTVYDKRLYNFKGDKVEVKVRDITTKIDDLSGKSIHESKEFEFLGVEY